MNWILGIAFAAIIAFVFTLAIRSHENKNIWTGKIND
jgi:phosphotransferase system  glucose/maltose/N-acetylglucosamine-specific IIC component